MTLENQAGKKPVRPAASSKDSKSRTGFDTSAFGSLKKFQDKQAYQKANFSFKLYPLHKS